MKFRQAYLIAVTIFLTMLFVACGGSDEVSQDDERAVSTPTISQATAEPVDIPSVTDAEEPTPEPTATAEPTATIEPTSDPGQENEQQADSTSGELSGELISYSGEMPISLNYPEDWTLTEDPGFGLLLESTEGFVDIMPGGDGAILFVIPQDPADLEGESARAKLLSAILRFGLPPAAEIADPETFSLENHEFATTEYVDAENGVNGFFSVVVNGDQAAVVFSASSGEDRLQMVEILSSVLNSVRLGESD